MSAAASVNFNLFTYLSTMEKDSLKEIKLEATCSICLQYFSKPMTIQCGHSFCYGCIMRFWRDFVSSKICPQCNKKTETDSIIANSPLENFSTLLQKTEENESEPLESCERHSEVLSFFCKDDTVPICSLCAIAEHRGHRVVPLEDVALEMKIYISTCLKFIRNRELAIWTYKTKVETKSQELLETVKRLSQEVDTVFRELHTSLEPIEDYLIDKLESTVIDITNTRSKDMSRFFWEVTSNESLIRELEKNHYLSAPVFLQNAWKIFEKCEQMKTHESPKPFSPKLSWELWNLSDSSFFMKHAVKQFKITLDIGSTLDEAIVTLDPTTAHPRLVLSEDLRSVRLGEEPQDLPYSAKRFETNFFVLGHEGFGEGRIYWDVIVESEGEWAVGVARRSIQRKTMVVPDSDSGIWAVGKQGGVYMAYRSPGFSPLSFDDNKEPKRIRVCLNCIGRNVTFFDADDITPLFQTPIIAAPRGSFFPFFHVSNKAVLRIAP